MGAIGGLFLGGSLLSILEIIYWLSKSLISIRWSLKHDNIRQQDPKKIFNPALLLIDNQTFFNKKIIVTKLNTRRF